MPIKIALADDNQSVIDSLLLNLSLFDKIEVVFTAKNGADFLQKLADNTIPQVILMDIEMPQMDGIATTMALTNKYPNQYKVLMLTAFEQDDKVFEAIKAGANGYLLKGESPANLVKAIHEVLESGSPMSPIIATKILNFLKISTVKKEVMLPEAKAPTDFNLTKREVEILQHISKGSAYKQIADLLFVSDKTIKKHIENIYQKLQVNSKYEAMTLAMKYNW
jgi:DNA-binding NarL/FixJ family response regulator